MTPPGDSANHLFRLTRYNFVIEIMIHCVYDIFDVYLTLQVQHHESREFLRLFRNGIKYEYQYLLHFKIILTVYLLPVVVS